MSSTNSDPPGAPDALPPDPPRLSGPEIPGADVNERGTFCVQKGDLDVYESARIEYCLEPLFEQEIPIAWLWPQRVPLGLVTVIEGAVSVGKSPLVADLVARVTRGSPWPGRVEGPQLAGEVLLVCGELGGWERMTLPRLKRAGADLARVAFLIDIDTCDPVVTVRDRSHTQRPLRFPGDLGHLEYALRARPQTRLVVIDPLAAYCPNQRAWRETLRKLHEIAARRNVAIVVVSGRPGRSSVRSRFQVSADPRSDEVRVLFNVLEDTEEEGRRLFAPARMSFCAAPEWLAFRIVGGRVVWEAPLAAPPEEALPPNPGRARGAVFGEVKEWLRTMLSKGDTTVRAATAEAKSLGYSEMTVRRAREALKVRTFRQGGGPHSVCWWTLRQEPDPAEDGPVGAMAEDERSQRSKGSKRSKSESGLASLPPLHKGGPGGIGTAEGGSKSDGAPDLPRRAADATPGAAPPVNPAPARRSKPRRAGARRKAPRKPARTASPGDWRHLREAVLEELNIADVMNGEPPSIIPPSNGNGRHSSNGEQSSNGRHDSNGDQDPTGKRRKPR